MILLFSCQNAANKIPGIVFAVEFSALTETSTGRLTKPLANARISGENVAENNKFCLCFGNNANIFLISLIKPISNIRSASSSTNISS